LTIKFPRGFFVSERLQRQETRVLYQTPFHNASLKTLLSQLEPLDRELARETREGRCPFCGGRLDSACYPRKARGVSEELDEVFSSRYSFCCAQEGCRRRSTPPSFRFLGRRVFVAAVVVLLCALEQGVTPQRAGKLREWVGVSRRTLERWRQWWQQEFVQTQLWKAARGRLGRPIREDHLPRSLLEAFGRLSAGDRIVDVLRFLLPLTAASGSHAC
jgi:hypothetical protein